jgi:hypothetical protein
MTDVPKGSVAQGERDERSGDAQELYWHLELSRNASFGDGFMVVLDAPSGVADCSLWTMQGSRFELVTPGELMQRKPRMIPRAQGNAIFEALAAATISAAPRFAMGLDGFTYCLNVNAGSNGAVYHWWVELPEEWLALKAPVIRLAEIAGVVVDV